MRSFASLESSSKSFRIINCKAVELLSLSFSFSLSLLDVADRDEFVDSLGEFELGSKMDKEVVKVAVFGDDDMFSTETELLCVETCECGSWCTTAFAKDWSELRTVCSLCSLFMGDEADGLIAMGLDTVNCCCCCAAWDACACACPFACCALDGVRRAAAKISADAVTRRSEDVYILTLFKQSLSYPARSYKPLVTQLYDT